MYMQYCPGGGGEDGTNDLCTSTPVLEKCTCIIARHALHNFTM